MCHTLVISTLRELGQQNCQESEASVSYRVSEFQVLYFSQHLQFVLECVLSIPNKPFSYLFTYLYWKVIFWGASQWICEPPLKGRVKFLVSAVGTLRTQGHLSRQQKGSLKRHGVCGDPNSALVSPAKWHFIYLVFPPISAVSWASEAVFCEAMTLCSIYKLRQKRSPAFLFSFFLFFLFFLSHSGFYLSEPSNPFKIVAFCWLPTKQGATGKSLAAPTTQEGEGSCGLCFLWCDLR